MLESFLEWRGRLAEPVFLSTWDNWLAFKGEWVQAVAGSSTQQAPARQGLVLGINADGSLRLRDRDGVEFALHTGELRLRII